MMTSPHRIVAMREAHIRVAAVSIKKFYVVFDNGVVLPITGFLDDGREATDDAYEMRYFEFGDDEHGFGIGDLDAYDMISWETH